MFVSMTRTAVSKPKERRRLATGMPTMSARPTSPGQGLRLSVCCARNRLSTGDAWNNAFPELPHLREATPIVEAALARGLCTVLVRRSARSGSPKSEA